MDGLLLVDKPSGISSHDVVVQVRRAAGMRRVGHGGTLDPLATGLLLIALGQATRTLDYLTAQDKVYEALVQLGRSTDSYDADGRVTATHEGALPHRSAVEAALNPLRGAIRQRVPSYSAVKRGGERLYEAARRGESVDLPVRSVVVYDLAVTRWDPPLLGMHVHCSKGTYIRSIAHDLGQLLGVGGHLAALRRTRSGPFSVSDAWALDELTSLPAQALARHLLPVGSGLEALPARRVTPQEEIDLRHGKALPGEAGLGLRRALDADGRLVAILAWREGRGWQPQKVFGG